MSLIKIEYEAPETSTSRARRTTTARPVFGQPSQEDDRRVFMLLDPNTITTMFHNGSTSPGNTKYYSLQWRAQDGRLQAINLLLTPSAASTLMDQIIYERSSNSKSKPKQLKLSAMSENDYHNPNDCGEYGCARCAAAEREAEDTCEASAS